jgi:hypothetical protein
MLLSPCTPLTLPDIFHGTIFLKTPAIFVRLQVLMVLRMKLSVFWDITPCSLVGTDRRFGGAYCLHHKGIHFIIAIMMETASTSETLVSFYQTARRNTLYKTLILALSLCSPVNGMCEAYAHTRQQANPVVAST